MDRYNSTKKISILGIIANLFLFIIKITVAIMSKSQGLLADSINSGSDIFTSFMTYVGNKLSSKPEDKEHPYGHGKVEYVFSLVISITMIFLSFKILQDAITSIIIKSEIIFSNSLIIVCIVTILIKFSLYIYTTRIGKLHENLLITAASEDHRNDMFLTSATLIGILAAKFGFNYVDGIVGIIISIWIGYIAIKLFLSAYDVLIDTDISDSLKNKVVSIITQQNICTLDSIKSRPVGVNYILLLEISVDKDKSLEEAHSVAEKIKSDVCSIDKIVDAVIHVNA